MTRNRDVSPIKSFSGGARLADDDNCWPIHIQNLYNILWDQTPWWNRHFAVGDVDNDDKKEVLQFLSMAPYNREHRYGFPGVRVEVMQLP